jgi:DNA-binding NarL/FixJ family response regulator
LLDDSTPAAIKRLHAAAPNAKILVFGLECDPVYANRALDAGAAGYIARETINGTLPELLHRIAEGERRLVCLS